MSDAIKRAESYFLVCAIVGNCLTFAIGPRLIDGEHGPDKKDDQKDQSYENGQNDGQQNGNAEQNGQDSNENQEDANEQTSLLPRPVISSEETVSNGFLTPLKTRFKQLSPRTQGILEFAGDFFNAPLFGAIVGAIIGLVPALHRAFFEDSQHGGVLNAWLTSSLNNIGNLFASLQIIVVGVNLSSSLRKMKRGEEGGSVPWLPLVFVIFIRFILWPILSIAIIYGLVSKTGILSDDPVLWFALMIMPTGPSAMKVLVMADVNGAEEEEMMSISKFLTAAIMNNLRHSVLRAARTQFLQPSSLSRSQPASNLRRLLSSLAVLEQRDGKLNLSSLSAITAAQKLGGSITAFVAGSNIQGVAEEAAKVDGTEKVIKVENAAYDKGLPENYAPLLVENIKKGGFTHVIAGHSAFGKSLIPRVAALLDSQQLSDVMGIESEDTFVRPIYAGNAILTVQSADPIKFLTVRQTAFAPAIPSSGSASIEDGVDPKVTPNIEWVSEDLAKSDRPELASADRVVSGGRGLKSKEEFDRLIPPLADSLGAAIGASRAAVDSGFADNSLQVGQTGKNVAPQLYLCAGISGAIQHLAGMKDSKVIAAINKDPDAPIFQVADVGLVGDLFEKVPELTEKLKK